MTEKELKAKTKAIAIAVGRLCEKLPSTRVNNTYIGQILRCSASVGANYRAACRAKSANDFVYKLQIVEEETDETLYFLELLAEFNPGFKAEMRLLYKETEVILKIVVASIKTSIKKDDYRPLIRQSKNQNQKSKTNER
ncbi:MAG TPA: four helix bundle protein [Chitinophagaceae bacterium]|nr:four helix bundle protein [Chitinophagaceae bacterium]